MRANFRGPIVKLLEPVVDYGLVKVNTESKYRINVENTSPIPAEIIIKNSKNKRLNFQTITDDPQLLSSKTSNGNTIKVNQISQIL